MATRHALRWQAAQEQATNPGVKAAHVEAFLSQSAQSHCCPLFSKRIPLTRRTWTVLAQHVQHNPRAGTAAGSTESPRTLTPAGAALHVGSLVTCWVDAIASAVVQPSSIRRAGWRAVKASTGGGGWQSHTICMAHCQAAHPAQLAAHHCCIKAVQHVPDGHPGALHQHLHHALVGAAAIDQAHSFKRALCTGGWESRWAGQQHDSNDVS